MKILLALVVLATGLISHAYCQTYPGQVPAGSVLANNTALPIPFPVPVTATSWFDQAYCNTIGAAIVRFTGVWTCSKYVAANPVWWGADPTDTTDSTSALNNALAASNTVVFPAGKFKFLSAISYNIPSGINSVTLKGQGQDVTILTWPNASGGITFNYNGINSSVHVRDLSLTTQTTNGGTALTLSLSTVAPGGSALGAASDIYRVTMRGDDGYRVTDYWSNGLLISNTAGIQIDNITVMGSSTQQGTGIDVTGLSASSFSTQIDVAKSTFMGLATGIIYGAFVQGVTVDQTNFTFVTSGIASAGSEGGPLVQLAVANSQFNPGTVSGGTGINLQTQIGGAQIINNFFVISGPNQFGIDLGNAGHFQITNNSMQGINSSAAAAIDIGTTVSSEPGIIANNDIFGFGSSGLGIVLSAAASNVIIQGNTFTANTTNISNAGTNISIVQNPGYNPVGPSAVTVGASPWTYTAGASPETLYYSTSNTGFSSIKQGGQTLATTVPTGVSITVDLGPNESIVVTDTSATRVLTKMVH